MQNRRGQESFQDTSTFFYDVLSFIPLLLCTSNFSSTCNPVLASYKRGEGIVRGGEKSSLKRKSFVDEDFLYGHMSCPRSTSRPLEKILLDFLGKRRRRNRVEGVPFNYHRDARSPPLLDSMPWKDAKRENEWNSLQNT